MPNVTYLRLDGSVPVSQRYALVNRFNVDPSIDTLIMTTQVGGLGLNLTGADTVCCVIYSLLISYFKIKTNNVPNVIIIYCRSFL